MIEAEVLGKYLIVEGFRNVRIDNIERVLSIIKANSEGSHTQILDADYVAGFEHIFFAVLNAIKSFRAGYNISRSLPIEILLFASGQDQIKRAIDLLGVKETTRNVVLIIVAESHEGAISALNSITNALGWKADHSVIELTDEKTQSIVNAFRITPLELEASRRGLLKDAIKNVLIERAAILVTQR
ncbi:MAG: KEOPS complex subunit Cgi121 [Candidatus Bathyarchaeia archaeon]